MVNAIKQKRTIIIVFASILMLIAIVTSGAYAYLVATKQGVSNYIYAGKLALVFNDNVTSDEPLNLVFNEAITSDEGIKSNNYYSFYIENKGDTSLDFEISLVNDEDYIVDSVKLLDHKYINYNLTINGEKGLSYNLSEVKDLLVSGTILPYEKIAYQLRMWLDKDTIKDESDKLRASNAIFAANLAIKAYQSKLVVVPDKCFTFSNNTIMDYDMSCGSVVVVPKIIKSNKVLYIGKDAFKNKNLENIYFPDTIKAIGKDAFTDNKLTKVVLPMLLTEIGDNAFSNNNLEEVVFNNGLSKIGDNAFSNNNLIYVDLSSTVRSIGSNAFLKNDVSNRYLSIINNASKQLFDWGDVTGSKSDVLISGTISNAYGNISIATLVDSKDIIINNEGTIEAINTRTINIVIPNTVNNIVVKDITSNICNINIKSIVLPTGITTIGDNTLKGCSSLQNIIIPKGIVEIGENSINVSNLSFINIPNSVSIIKNNALVDINNLIIRNNTKQSFNWGGIIGKSANSFVTGEIEEVLKVID